MLAASLTRLRFSSADGSGAEVHVRGLSAPIRFAMPAPSAAAGSAPEGSDAACVYWDAAAGAFSGEGCAALPGRLPRGHAVAWAPLGPPAAEGADAEAAVPPPPAMSAAPPLPPPPPAGDAACALVPTTAPPGAAGCAALLDDAGRAVLAALSGAPDGAARQLPVAWDATGPLFCGCNVTYLDCAAEAAAAEQAAAEALDIGASDAATAAAVAAVRRKVYLSPRDALVVPAVTCPAGSTALMKAYYGETCAAWRGGSVTASGDSGGGGGGGSGNGYGCAWVASRQTFDGPCCAPPPATVQCSCLHLTGACGPFPSSLASEPSVLMRCGRRL